jgi:hypothetical protein
MERNFKSISISEVDRLLPKYLSWQGCYDFVNLKNQCEYLHILLAVLSISPVTPVMEKDVLELTRYSSHGKQSVKSHMIGIPGMHRRWLGER